MKACDEKLRSSLMEAMRLDNARLEEEMKHCEPHVFSEAFERNMEKMIRVQKWKGMLRTCVRYVAAAVVVLLLSGSIMIIGSEELRASELSIDILEWLDKFFTVEDGDHRRKEDGVLFDENQIGYVPEGFEKVGELVSFTSAQFDYVNKSGNYITINACRNKMLNQIDGEDVREEVHVNEMGYEYTQIWKTGTYENLIMWKDKNEIYYYIVGTIKMEELVIIMNNISYER